jgi:hypothetical protein
MKNKDTRDTDAASSGPSILRAALLGLAGGLAVYGLLAKANQPKLRRFSDRGEDRRNPMHFFLAGRFPHRREIDRSGKRPLFERRQSVYDAY